MPDSAAAAGPSSLDLHCTCSNSSRCPHPHPSSLTAHPGSAPGRPRSPPLLATTQALINDYNSLKLPLFVPYPAIVKLIERFQGG